MVSHIARHAQANFRLAPHEIAYILTDSATSLLVVEEATAGAAARARAAFGLQIGFVSMGLAGGADPYFPAPAEPPAVDVPEDAPALIMYTSHHRVSQGCGALPPEPSVPVAHAHPGPAALDGHEVNLCASPLFHIASIGAIAPMALIGDTTVLLPSGGFSSSATLELWKPNGLPACFSCRLNGSRSAPRWRTPWPRNASGKVMKTALRGRLG